MRIVPWISQVKKSNLSVKSTNDLKGELLRKIRFEILGTSEQELYGKSEFVKLDKKNLNSA